MRRGRARGTEDALTGDDMRRLMLVLLSALSATASAQTDIAPFQASELAPGVHLLSTPAEYRGNYIGNVTIIEQRDGFIVIDSGGAVADGRRIAAFVKARSGKRIKAVAITHWHHDHPLGVSAIRDAWPKVRVIATPQTRAAMLGPALKYVALKPSEKVDAATVNQLSASLSRARAGLADPSAPEDIRARWRRVVTDVTARMGDVSGTYLVPPTETFEKELLLDDPVTPVRLLFLGRSNTDGDAVAWLPKQRIVAAGDVVVAPTPFGFYSFPGEWLLVIDRLKALDFAVLIPGHGEPQRDTGYVDRLRASIVDIRTRVGTLARQGLSLDEVKAKIDYTAQLDQFGDTPRNRQLFDAFWLKPMTVNAWKEARGEGFAQGDEALYK